MADNSLRYRTNPVFPRTSPSTEYAAPRGASRSGYDPDSRSFSDGNTDPLAELARLVGDVDPHGDTRVDTRPAAGAGHSEAYPLSPAQAAHWDDAAARISAPPLGEYETAGDEACCDLIGHRRFIRGASRGCKVRFSQGDIIDSAVDVEAGQLAKADTGQPRNQGSGRLELRRIGERRKTRDLGQPGNWSIAVAKGECPGQPGDSTKANRMVRDPR